MESTPCKLCANLPGCPHLANQDQFLDHKVIDESTNPGVCEDFALMGERETEFREAMYECAGTAYLRAVHIFPRTALQDIEEEDEDMIEVPDFAGMIIEGMTVEERIDQLMFETDDDGNLIEDETGNKIPRGELSVRKYASDPEGPVGSPGCHTLGHDDFNRVLDELIKAERKLYGLTGRKASKKKKKAAAKKVTEEKETTKMAVKPRITLRKRGGGPVKADKTPSKVKGKVSKA